MMNEQELNNYVENLHLYDRTDEYPYQHIEDMGGEYVQLVHIEPTLKHYFIEKMKKFSVVSENMYNELFHTMVEEIQGSFHEQHHEEYIEVTVENWVKVWVEENEMTEAEKSAIGYKRVSFNS